MSIITAVTDSTAYLPPELVTRYGVVEILTSGELSGTVASALAARESLSDLPIEVVDSLPTSILQVTIHGRTRPRYRHPRRAEDGRGEILRWRESDAYV